MANIKFGALIADARGSIGGLTLSRGTGGSIGRTNIKPVNPNSASQNARRSALSRMSLRWQSAAMAANRGGWNDYAANTSWTNKVGGVATITGLSAYIRINTIRLMAELSITDTAPLAYGHAGMPSFTILANPTTHQLTVSLPSAPYDNADPLNTEFFFIYPPTSPGRIALPSARQYSGKVSGVASPPPTWPNVTTPPYVFGAGQRMAVAGLLIDNQGRMSAEYVAQVIAAAP